MDLGNALNNATSAASNAAGNAVSNAASNVASQTSGNIAGNIGSDLTNQAMPNSNIPASLDGAPSSDVSSQNIGDNQEVLTNNDENLELPQSKNDSQANSNGENPEGPAPGTKVAPGKEVGEDGQVKDSSTKKLTKAVGQGAAAYFTGGQSLGKDQAIKNNGLVDKAIGVVSDVAEKTPGVKAIADELDKAGVIDAANDAMDMVGDIKNGDIGGAIEKGKDVVKDQGKMQKYAAKKLLPLIIASAAGGFFFLIIIFGIVSPIAGGILDLTEKIGEFIDAVGDFLGNLFGGSEAYDILTDLVEDYENLSEEQKQIVIVAASALGKNYNWGGHPTGPGYDGFPTTGLDCAGFVQWVLWTAYGTNPGTLTTDAISDLIGTKFVEISKSELEPGDIGLKFREHKVGVTNHTGIYAGNDNWIHAAGAKSGVINSKYSGFTIYLRYVG